MQSEQTTEVKISVAEGGPFVIQGAPTMRTADAVYSEKGEPMTWSFGDPQTIEEGSALCRCGASSNKPFCDGSHQEHEWDAESGARPGSFVDRAKALNGTKLTVYDDPSLCMHAGFCGTEKRSVWSMMDSTDDTETRATVIRMVEKCPSGRLVNVIDGDEVEPALPQSIGVVPDGPLWVTGNIPVALPDGSAIEVRNRVTLCRCGASSTKPLCDGSHKEIGFSAGGA